MVMLGQVEGLLSVEEKLDKNLKLLPNPGYWISKINFRRIECKLMIVIIFNVNKSLYMLYET